MNTTISQEQLQRKLSNGEWFDIDIESINLFLEKAVARENEIAGFQKREPRSIKDLEDLLIAGKSLDYGTDWYEQIRIKPVKTSHELPTPPMMTTSTGKLVDPDEWDRIEGMS